MIAAAGVVFPSMGMAEALNTDTAETRGEMAERVRARDWSRTPLGPAEHWPQSLRTAANICIDSGFPMLVCWGPELVMIYNDSTTQVQCAFAFTVYKLP